jgi:catecholate siderophore receptor
MKCKLKLRPLAVSVAGGACIALAPGVVAAQGRSPSPTPPDTTLPEVKVKESAPGNDYNPPVATVGGGVPTPIRDIPQSITVINSALMQAQGATSLADALRNVPGITLGAAEGGSIGNNFNLRGFSARTDPRRTTTAAPPTKSSIRIRARRGSITSSPPTAIRHSGG